MRADKPKHVLIIRLSAMGDVAMSVPVVEQLRRDYPSLKITILTRPFFKPFFREIENIEFVEPDFKGRHKGLKGLWLLFREIQALGVDAVADLHDVLRTKVLDTMFRLTGTRVAVIDKGRMAKKTLTRKFRKFMVPLTPTVERYRQTIAELGFDLELSDTVVRTQHPVPQPIVEIMGEKSGRWIGFAPFAQHKGKIYPTILSDEVIGLLSNRYDQVFIFGGGTYERDFAECMQIRHPRVISVIGMMSLDEEIDLISHLDCMITMDSASMHMASLVGTPVVSVWGATHPYAGFYGYGQNQSNAVQLDMPCRPCSVYGNKQCIYKDYRCLSNIAPQTIVDKVDLIVQRV